MSRNRLVRLLATAGLFVLGGCLAAQEVDPDAARRQLIEALRSRGGNEAVQILPVQPETFDQVRQGRLLQGASDEAPLAPPAERQDVVDAVVDELQGPPAAPGEPLRTIRYEVTILHLASPRDFTPEETEISHENVADKIAQWREQGMIAEASTIRFASMEEEPAFVQLGEQVPVVVGRSFFGGRGGSAQAQVEYQETGTLIGATGRTQGDQVLLEIDVEQSRLEMPTGTIDPAAEATGGGDEALAGQSSPGESLNVARPGRRQTKMQTTVTVRDGQTIVLSHCFTRSEKSSTGMVMTLRASIGD